MEQHVIDVEGRRVDGYVVPLAGVNLVFAVSDSAMICCGAFDVAALDKFGYPAAKVRAERGAIATITDLLEGNVAEANVAAVERGVQSGMSGRTALKIM